MVSCWSRAPSSLSSPGPISRPIARRKPSSIRGCNRFATNLRNVPVEVLELLPPYVATELTGAQQAADPRALPLAAFVSEVLQLIEEGSLPNGEILVERLPCGSCSGAGGTPTMRLSPQRTRTSCGVRVCAAAGWQAAAHVGGSRLSERGRGPDIPPKGGSLSGVQFAARRASFWASLTVSQMAETRK